MGFDPRVLQGEDAVSAHRNALTNVATLVPYLKAEIGPVACVDTTAHAVGAALEDGTWLASRDLIDDSRWLCEVIRSSGTAIGTDDPVVAASIFVQGYAYRLFALTVACATAAGIVPNSDPSTLAIGCSRGRAAKVAYVTPSVVDIGHGRSPADVLRDKDVADDSLRLILDRTIDGHLRPLVTSVRSEIRIGERLLWGNIATSASTAFRTMEGCLGGWIIPLGERFFELAPRDLKGLGSFLTLERGDRRGWFWERTNCCLFDRVAGKIRCSDCRLTPPDERRAAYAASLES